MARKPVILLWCWGCWGKEGYELWRQPGLSTRHGWEYNSVVECMFIPNEFLGLSAPTLNKNPHKKARSFSRQSQADLLWLPTHTGGKIEWNPVTNILSGCWESTTPNDRLARCVERLSCYFLCHLIIFKFLCSSTDGNQDLIHFRDKSSMKKSHPQPQSFTFFKQLAKMVQDSNPTEPNRSKDANNKR